MESIARSSSLASATKKVTKKVNFGFEIRRTYDPKIPGLPDPDPDAELTKAISDCSYTAPRTPPLGVPSSDDDEVGESQFPTTVEYSDLQGREPSVDKRNSFAHFLGRRTSDSGSSGGESVPEEPKSADAGANAASPIVTGSRINSPMDDTPVSAINSSNHLVLDENTVTLFKPSETLDDDLSKSLHERIRTSTERGLKSTSKGKKTQNHVKRRNSIALADVSPLNAAGAGRGQSEERTNFHVLEERTNTQEAGPHEDHCISITGRGHGESGTNVEDRCISVTRSNENVAPRGDEKREDSNNVLSDDEDFPPLPFVTNSTAAHLLSSDEENDALGGNGSNNPPMRRSVAEDTLYSPSEEELMVEAFDRSTAGEHYRTKCVLQDTIMTPALNDTTVFLPHKRTKTSSDTDTCSPAKRRKSLESEMEDAPQPDYADLINASDNSRLRRTKDSLALRNRTRYTSSMSSSSGSLTRRRVSNLLPEPRKTERKARLSIDMPAASSLSPLKRSGKRVSSIGDLGSRSTCAQGVGDATASALPSFSYSPARGRMSMEERKRKLREVGGGASPLSSSDEEFDYRLQSSSAQQRPSRSKNDDSPSRLRTTPGINKLSDVTAEESGMPKTATRKELSELRQRELLDMVDSSPDSESDIGNREQKSHFSGEAARLPGALDSVNDSAQQSRDSSAVSMELAVTSSNDETSSGILLGPSRRLEDTTSRIKVAADEVDHPASRSSVGGLASSSYSSNQYLSDTLSMPDPCCRHLVFEDTTSPNDKLSQHILDSSEPQVLVEKTASRDVTPSDMVIDELTLSNANNNITLQDSSSTSMSDPCDGRRFFFEDTTSRTNSMAADNVTLGDISNRQQRNSTIPSSSSYAPNTVTTLGDMPSRILLENSPLLYAAAPARERQLLRDQRKSMVEFEMGREIFIDTASDDQGVSEATKLSAENSVSNEDQGESDNMKLETPPNKGAAMSPKPLHRRIKSPSLQTSMSINTRRPTLFDRVGDENEDADAGVSMPGLHTPVLSKKRKSVFETTHERHPQNAPSAPPHHTPSEPPAPPTTVTQVTQVTQTTPALAQPDNHAPSPTPARLSAAAAVAASPRSRHASSMSTPTRIPTGRPSNPPLPPLPLAALTPSPSSRPVFSPTNIRLSPHSDTSSEWASPSAQGMNLRGGQDIFGIHHGMAPLVECAMSPSKFPLPRELDSLSLLDADLANPKIVRPLKGSMWEEVVMEEDEGEEGGTEQLEDKWMGVHAAISEACEDMPVEDHLSDSPAPSPSPMQTDEFFLSPNYRPTADVRHEGLHDNDSDDNAKHSARRAEFAQLPPSRGMVSDEFDSMFHGRGLHGRGLRASRSPSTFAVRAPETLLVDDSDSECRAGFVSANAVRASATTANVAAASASTAPANVAVVSASTAPANVAAVSASATTANVAAASASATTANVAAASSCAAPTNMVAASSSTASASMVAARTQATAGKGDFQQFLEKCGIHIPLIEPPKQFPSLDRIIRDSFPEGLGGIARTLFTALEASRRKLILQDFRWLPRSSTNYQSSVNYMDIYNSAVERNQDAILKKQVQIVWYNARVRACLELRDHSLHTQRSVDDAAKTFLEILAKQKEKMVKRVQLVKRLQGRMTALRNERGILDTNISDSLALAMKQTAEQQVLESQKAAAVAEKTAELEKIEQDIEDVRAVRRAHAEKSDQYKARILETRQLCKRLVKRILGCKFRQTLVPWQKVDDHYEMNGHKIFLTMPRAHGLHGEKWRFEPRETRRLPKLAKRAFAEAFSYAQNHGGVELFSFAAHVKNIQNLWFDIYDVIDDWMPTGIYVMFPDSHEELCVRFQVARRAIISPDWCLIKETIDELGVIFSIRWPVDMWAVRPARVQWFHRGSVSVIVTPGRDGNGVLRGILEKKLQTLEYENWQMKSLLSEIGITAQEFLNDMAKYPSTENTAWFDKIS